MKRTQVQLIVHRQIWMTVTIPLTFFQRHINFAESFKLKKFRTFSS